LIVFCEREFGGVSRLISARRATAKERKHMKKQYDLKKLKRRPGTLKSDSEAVKTPISIRLDGSVLAALKTEADRLGIPYQTYIGSVLYRFAQGELIDRKTVDLLKQLKVS
jgi:predicted DNA binding CopG/RHH family protein